MLFKHKETNEYLLTEDSETGLHIAFYKVNETKTIVGHTTYFKESIKEFPEDLKEKYTIMYDPYLERMFHLLKDTTARVLNPTLLIKQLHKLTKENLTEKDLLAVIINTILATKEISNVQFEDIINYQNHPQIEWGSTGSTFNNINIGFSSQEDFTHVEETVQVCTGFNLEES